MALSCPANSDDAFQTDQEVSWNLDQKNAGHTMMMFLHASTAVWQLLAVTSDVAVGYPECTGLAMMLGLNAIWVHSLPSPRYAPPSAPIAVAWW